MFDFRLDPAFQSDLIIKIELNGKMTDRLQVRKVGGTEKRGSTKTEGVVGKCFAPIGLSGIIEGTREGCILKEL
jgi:hypothetical protein